jgi:hypothetical protein
MRRHAKAAPYMYKGECDACTISASRLRNSGADLNLQSCVGQERRSKSQELSDGATVSLGELQEDMRVGEGLPLGRRAAGA